MTDLISALTALTKPTRRKIIQDNPAGPQPTKMVEVVDAALLEQLDEAIRSSMGGTTSGGSDPATRSLFDADALERMAAISAKVNSWARMAGSVIDKGSVSVTLERWHVKFIGDALVTNHDVYAGIMRKWAAQISAALDRPREKDLPDECPNCGAKEWWRDGVRYYRPLIIRYRPADSGVVKDATAACRACEETWGARELAFELEEAAKKGAA